MKDKTIAALLAITPLGWIGAHRMYLGQFGKGVMYFLVTMFTFPYMRIPIMAIVGVIDAIALFSMSQKEFDLKYNRGPLSRKVRTSTKRRVPANTNNREMRRRQWRMEREAQRTQRRRTTKRTRPTTGNRIQNRKANELKTRGIKKFREYEYQEALEDFQKALEITATDPTLHFNLACTYSVMEEADKSLFHIDQAVANGFKNSEKIMNHEALAYVRVDPRFDALVKNNYRLPSQRNEVKEVEDKPQESSRNLLEDLKNLAEMRNRGELSEEEFIRQKEKLMR
jgi:TM2 domain-containing membrane protein YozV